MNLCLFILLSLKLQQFIIALNYVTKDPTINLVLILRPRSKHTSKMHPLTKWSLPITEINQLHLGLGGSRDSFHLSYIQDKRKAPNIRNEEVVYITSKSSQLNTLIAAVRKSVLIHGLYTICGYGNTSEETMNVFTSLLFNLSLQNISLSSSSTIMNHNPTNDSHTASSNCSSVFDVVQGLSSIDIDIAIGVFENPWIEQSYIQPIFDLIHQTINTSPLHLKSNSIFAMNINNNEAHLFQKSIKNQMDSSTSSSKLSLRLLFGDTIGGKSILCQQLAEGLAASKHSGQGHRYPLPISKALRRPTSGIFSRLSLHKMPYKTLTAMEPELALLMANLAGIDSATSSESRVAVLDPFCGSCSLLAAAAIQGASKLVGIDANFDAINTQGIADNFKYLNITDKTPQVLHGFIEDFIGMISSKTNKTAVDNNFKENTYPSINNQGVISINEYIEQYFNGSEKYNAIITDPPYGIQETVRAPASKNHSPTAIKRKGRQPVTSMFPDNLCKDTNLTSAFLPLKDNPMIITLMKLAHMLLIKGGKLVCFIPYRQNYTLPLISSAESINYFPMDENNDCSDINTEDIITGSNHNYIRSVDRKIFSDDPIAISQLLSIEDCIIMNESSSSNSSSSTSTSNSSSSTSTSSSNSSSSTSSSLKLVVAHKQYFSPTLSRYLCVFEKL